MSKPDAPIADRLRSFGQSKFGTEHGWKARFASALGISAQHLERYLSGAAEPGKKMYLRLIRLGCDVQWLLTGIAHTPRAGERISEREKDLLTELKNAGINTPEQVRYMFSPKGLATDIANAAVKEIQSRYRPGRARRQERS